jgi:uncharacterized membrane protein YvbJ
MMCQQHKIQKEINKQSGVAVVETAIVISVLIILLLVSAEFGRLFYHSNEFTKSIRNAARYVSNDAINSALVMEINDDTRIKAKNLLIYGDITGTGTSMFSGLTQENITISENDPYISIQAEWEYLTMFGSVLPNFGIASGDSYTLKSGISMRALE